MNNSGIAPLQIDKSEKVELVSTEDYELIAKKALKCADEFLKIADPYNVFTDVTLGCNHAFCTNMMFSCELYIKSLLFFNKITFYKEHSLGKLFALLPNSLKISIRSECSKAENFDLQLNEISKAFEVFRYAYEYTCLAYDFNFMAMLECALYTIAHREIKERI